MSDLAEKMGPVRRLVPRCGAKTRKGDPCAAPAVCDGAGRPVNGRCRRHGGLSTGPRTEEGREAVRQGQLRRWAAWRAERASQAEKAA